MDVEVKDGEVALKNCEYLMGGQNSDGKIKIISLTIKGKKMVLYVDFKDDKVWVKVTGTQDGELLTCTVTVTLLSSVPDRSIKNKFQLSCPKRNDLRSLLSHTDVLEEAYGYMYDRKQFTDTLKFRVEVSM